MIRAARVSAVLCVVALVNIVSFPLVSGADQWTPTFPPNSIFNFTVSDNVAVPNSSGISAFVGADNSQGLPTQTANQICPSITSSGPCNLTASGTAGGASALLPECTTPQQDDCVASMSLGTDATDMVASTPTGMTLGQTSPADASLGLPAGSTVGLWTNPLVNGGGTNTYATSADVQLIFQNGQATISYVSVAIDPYDEVSDPQAETAAWQQITVNGSPEISVAWGPGNCAWEQAGECGQFEDFPSGTVAQLTLRVPSSVGGWFAGRLDSPSITESAVDSTTDLLTVTGGAVTTPTLALGYTASNLPASLSAFMASLNLPTSGVSFDVLSNNPQSFTALSALRDPAENMASGAITVWNFSSIPVAPLVGPKGCFDTPDQVDGFVSTNSMIYQSTSPSFANGSFGYQVAGMHYNAGGSVMEGTYDLNIRDSVAECLYGFTNAPISASVSVTEDSSGDQNVATTTVSDADGWLHVGAYGFNFSNPTIQVKLTQKKVKRTLICVKGKLVRKVVTTNRSCPAGFKKR